MKIFLGTSSLFKLYHEEIDTPLIEQIFLDTKIKCVYLSEITRIEFASSIWKKVRTKEVTEAEAKDTLQLFENDYAKFTFITIDSIIVEQAKNLTVKYGLKGLRTLDSIQLSCAVTLVQEVDLFVTSDILLKAVFIEEGLPTEIKIKE